MRVLILHSRYLSGPVSGENRVVEDELRLLREAGHDVVAWTPAPAHPKGLDLIRTGADSVWSTAAAEHVRRTVREREIEVVHCHNLFPSLSPSVIRAAADGGAGVVMTLHNYRLTCIAGTLLRGGKICESCLGRAPIPGVIHRCYRNSALGSATLAGSIWMHRTLGSFDRVSLFLAISQFVREKHVSAGIESARIRVKPHFAWPTAAREDAGDYILYLGRLAPEKGLGSLFAAWSSSFGRLVIAGDGPLAVDLRRTAPQGTEFVGTVEPEAVTELLRRARAVVVPSLCYEGAGRVVVEAFAAGVPVLASRIGGLPESIEDNVNGLLAIPGDVADWRRVLSQIADHGESKRLGLGALEAWKRMYNPDQARANLEAGYKAALEVRDLG